MAGPGALGVDLAPYISAARVLCLEQPLSKRELLARLIDLTAAHPWVTDKQAFAQAIFDREEVTSTGIGQGVAVPHARLPSVVGFVISIAVCPPGIEFAAQDGRPVHVAVMIAATDQDRKTYLRVLASVAARLRAPGVVLALGHAVGDRERIASTFLTG